jgi:hypothetical protein
MTQITNYFSEYNLNLQISTSGVGRELLNSLEARKSAICYKAFQKGRDL